MMRDHPIEAAAETGSKPGSGVRRPRFGGERVSPRATETATPVTPTVAPVAPARGKGAFSPNSKAAPIPLNADAGEPSVVATGEEGPSLSFLKPDTKAIEHLEAASGQGAELAQNAARSKTLSLVNGVRSLAPAIALAMRNGSDDVQQGQRFVEIFERAHAWALEVAKAMAIDVDLTKNRWMLNVLERLFVESLCHPDGAPIKGPSGTALAQAIVAVAERRSSEAPEYHPLPAHLHVGFSVMQAMGPVLAAQQAFDFYRDRDADIATLSRLLIDRAAEAVVELVDPITREADRAMLFGVLIDEAGKALAQCWRLESARTIAVLREKSKTELESVLKARPNGLPIEPIVDAFEQQFRRLKKLVLLPPAPKTPRVKARKV